MHDESPPRSPAAGDQDTHRQTRRLRVWAMIVLVPVAVIGAALSFQSLYRAAEPVFGPRLALGFPLLVDFLILGTSLQYVAGARVGRPRAGWRWTAHAGVAGTLFLNALAAHGVREVPWHVTAPAVWSVLVELTAREVLGQWRAAHAPLGDRIPLRLWLTAPVESGRTWLRIARRVEGEQALARLDVGVHAAALEALKLALPSRRARRVRRILRRQLRAGSLPPAAVLGPLGWMDDADALAEVTPASVLRAALRDTLRGTAPAAPVAAVTAAPDAAPLALTAPPAAPVPVVPVPAVQVPAVPAPADTTPVEVPAVPAAPIVQAPAATVRRPPAVVAPAATPAPTAGITIDLTGEPPHAPAPPRRPATRRPPAARPDQAPEADGPDDPDLAPPSGGVSSGDRFADAVDIVRVHETISATQLATQLRALGWQLSDRTAARVLVEAREHLMRLDPWALPTP